MIMTTKIFFTFLFPSQYRGNAGSHDLPFSVETLTSLTKMSREGGYLNSFFLFIILYCILNIIYCYLKYRYQDEVTKI
jgi:hypothetical protein